MLDEQVIALAKAIRQYETGNRPVSGATGELVSRYQFLPSTWSELANRILGDSNAPLTLENENKVAYTRILEWKNQGYNPGQIASLWNSGDPDMYAKGNQGIGQSSANPDIQFNVPKYVKGVYDLYQQYKPEPFAEPEISVSEKKDIISAETYRPTIGGIQILPYFPSDTESTSPLKEGLKTISNIPSSLFNFGKGVIDFFNPFKTVEKVQEFGTELGTYLENKKQGKVEPGLLSIIGAIPEALTETLVPKLIQDIARAGGESLSKALNLDNEAEEAWAEVQRTATNDPLNILPAVLIFDQLAKGTKTGEAFNKIVSKVSKPFESTIKAAIEKPISGIKKTTGFVASQITGLNPETIAQVLLKPEYFTAEEMVKLDRVSLAERVKNAIDKRLTALSATGKEYNTIRQSSSIAEINPLEILEVFNKYGIKFDDTGKIIRDTETPPLKPGDITAFEDFKKIFGNETYLSANAFLNARATLSEMSKFDSTKTALSSRIARELRKIYDKTGKTQIPGLNDLDIVYAPEVRQLQQLKKDYLKPNGDLKDGALNKIANLTGKGKDLTLARLENILPGIAEEIRILKAIEDIKTASGQKVGTYMRAGLTGGLLVSGNPLIAIIQLLMSQPSVVIPILRAFGSAKNISFKIIDSIIDKLKSGNKLNDKEQNILDLSIDDLLKRIIGLGKQKK